MSMTDEEYEKEYNRVFETWCQSDRDIMGLLKYQYGMIKTLTDRVSAHEVYHCLEERMKRERTRQA